MRKGSGHARLVYLRMCHVNIQENTCNFIMFVTNTCNELFIVDNYTTKYNLMHDLFLLICELFLLTLTLECTIWGSAFLKGINPAVCSYTTKETSMVTS